VSDAPGVPTAEAPVATPHLPDHWSELGVWPLREVCPNDGSGAHAFDAADPLIGVSPLDVIGAVASAAPWSLASADGQARHSLAAVPRHL
jgi:hypothetical protein